MDKLQQFFANDWAVERRGFDNLMALLTPCILSGNIQAANEILSKPKVSAMAMAAPYIAPSYRADDTSLPDGSIVVINLVGVLYSWETSWLITKLQEAEHNPAVVGVVLCIDGPGGQVTRVDVAADMLRNFSKPAATVVMGYMCSAHYWIGSSTGRVFVESKLCQIGSVGSLAEFCSFAEYYKQNGIDMRQIYPDSSDLKNEELRAIEERNDESITKARLEGIHALFSQTIAENRGIKYDPEAELFRGKVFDAATAVAAGYVDQFGGVGDAARWVLARAMSQKAQNMY